MRKNLWVVIVIGILVIIGVFAFSSNLLPEEVSDDRGNEILTLFKNVEILVPDSNQAVQLINGSGSYEIVPGAASRGEITILNESLTVWEKDERTDLIAVITSNLGGLGIFYYLVLFDVANGVFTKKSEVFLGDRIQVMRVGIGELVHSPDANYRVTIQTRIRDQDESFATEPTIPETKTFYVTNQVFEEIEVGLDDS